MRLTVQNRSSDAIVTKLKQRPTVTLKVPLSYHFGPAAFSSSTTSPPSSSSTSSIRLFQPMLMVCSAPARFPYYAMNQRKKNFNGDSSSNPTVDFKRLNVSR